MPKGTRADRKLARFTKQFNKRPLPAFINLVEWLQSRGYADSVGQAQRLILDGRVMAASHIVGRTKATVVEAGRFGKKDKIIEKNIVTPLVPAELRNDLTVKE